LGDPIEDLTKTLLSLTERYGLFGVFLISFVGNAIPYATVPYLALIAALAAQKSLTLPEAVLWSVVGGLGAALGKVVVYLTGVGTSELLPEKVRKNFELFSKIAQRGIFVAVFLFAALPLPDDVLYVPLGVARYPLIKFFFAVWLGKIIITFLSIAFGNAYSRIMEEYNVNATESAIILIVATVVLMVIIGRMDWARIAIALSQRGTLYALYVMSDELAKAIGLKWLARKISSLLSKPEGAGH